MFSRFLSLLRKEVRQLLRDKRLVFLLLFPPTIQLMVYGAVLNPVVMHLPMVLVDEARTPASRKLADALVQSQAFDLIASTTEHEYADRLVSSGKAVIEVNIPPDFQRVLDGGEEPHVQVIVNAVDAFSSGLASGYAMQAINSFSQKLRPIPSTVDPEIIFAYNPGLVSAWFFVSGMLGMIIMMSASLVATGVVGREKDSGTLEQLLVTPVEISQIIAAKVIPLFVLLFGDVILGIACGRLVFGLPFNGNVFLFLLCASLYIVVGISIGILLATLTRNQQQAQLLSFFVNLPIIQLSGSIAPFESMPLFCQQISWFNPLRHFTEIVRAIVLRGAGIDVIWPNILMLALIAIASFTVSVSMFRKRAV